MAHAVPLERLQRWMQTVVVHPGTVDEAVSSPQAEFEVPASRLGDVVLPSETLTPLERIGVYHGMYLLRMRDVLGGDYEALEHFMGEMAFTGLVRGYVEAYPSRSYSLNRLGERLPEYLRNAPRVKHRGFCVDLARLELAVEQAFDAPETEALTEAAIAAVPAEAWEKARLRTVDAFRLLAFRYPVNAYLQSVRDEDHDHPRPRRQDTWVAVYRRDFKVWRLDLSRDAHALLADLAQGVSLGQAVGAALKRGGRKPPDTEDLFRWFRQWASGGVFRSVDLSASA
jgi:putative DNA-binding protein